MRNNVLLGRHYREIGSVVQGERIQMFQMCSVACLRDLFPSNLIFSFVSGNTAAQIAIICSS